MRLPPHPHFNGQRFDVPTTQQADCQPLPPSLRSERVRIEEACDEAARFDAVLGRVLGQIYTAGGHASERAITGVRTQPEEAVEEVVEEAKAVNKGGPSKKSKAKKKTKNGQSRGQKYIKVSLCSHEDWWDQVRGRWRCEYHKTSTAKRVYRNPFRYKCPGCGTVACGLCLGRIKGRDGL